MNSIEELKNKLNDFRNKLMLLEGTDEWFSEYEKFREVMMKYKDDEAVKSLMDSFMNSYKSDFDSFYEFYSKCEERYIITSEKIISDNFLSKFDDEINPLDLGNEAIDKTSEHVVAEKEMLKTLIDPQGSGLKNKSLIMIGSGPFPESTIIYSKEDFESILGIDKDKVAISKAEKVIEKLKLSKIVSFVKVKGELYDNYADADLIIIGNFVKPKLNVLQTVTENITNKTLILLRLPSSIDQLCSEPISVEQIRELGLEIIKKLDKTFDIGDTTWFLKKKNTNIKR